MPDLSCGYKLFFLPYSNEHEILIAHKNLNAEKKKDFSSF